MPRIDFKDVGKTYPDGTRAVANLNLAVKNGELLCLLGPSGCGKSSTIRALAGLEPISEGMILADNERIDHLPPQARDCGMIFENYALYPHLTTFENIAMPLRARRMLPREIKERVIRIASMLRIDSLLQRRPNRLSGGEKQRVGIGRAIVREPSMLLMDEPLGHLETYLRIELRGEIRRLQERLGITTIYVTHDQKEAAAMGDRIAVMSAGRLQQVGSFLDLFDHPINRFVAETIGEPPMTFLQLDRTGPDSVAVNGIKIPLSDPLKAALRATAHSDLTLGVRPNDISIVPPAAEHLNGEVTLVQPQGEHAIVVVKTNSGPVTVVVPSERPPWSGAAVGLAFTGEALHVFDSSTRSLVCRMEKSSG